MPRGHMKYRHLSRSSSHRQALLRNLVTSLFKHESIATTWHKAKEAQRLAEQLVTLGKKNDTAESTPDILCEHTNATGASCVLIAAGTERDGA
jgi:ribosomal protein L17